jgi:hypothetical protein
MQAIRSGLRKLTGKLFLRLWLGNFLLLLLAVGWLQIPDSHAWQFALSVLSGVVLVLAFLWLYVGAFRQMRACGRPPWWQSLLALACVVGVWCVLLVPIGAGRAHEAIFAGYWNSQSPAWLRPHLGYSGLVTCQERIYDSIQYLLAGFLLPIAVEVCSCGFSQVSWQHATRAYRRWLYWFCVLLFAFTGSALTRALVDWAPIAGLSLQIFSISLRLAIAYTFNIFLCCVLLALTSYYLDGEV